MAKVFRFRALNREWNEGRDRRSRMNWPAGVGPGLTGEKGGDWRDEGKSPDRIGTEVRLLEREGGGGGVKRGLFS